MQNVWRCEEEEWLGRGVTLSADIDLVLCMFNIGALLIFL